MGASASGDEPQYASRIAYWRARRGISQRALAVGTGFSDKTIERMDQGRVENANVRKLLAIAHVLEVPLIELVEDDWRQFTVAGKRLEALPSSSLS